MAKHLLLLALGFVTSLWAAPPPPDGSGAACRVRVQHAELRIKTLRGLGAREEPVVVLGNPVRPLLVIPMETEVTFHAAAPKPLVYAGKTYTGKEVSIVLRPTEKPADVLAEALGLPSGKDLSSLGSGGNNVVFKDPRKAGQALKIPNAPYLQAKKAMGKVAEDIATEEVVGQALADYFVPRGIRVVIPRLAKDPKLAALAVREVEEVAGAVPLQTLLVNIEKKLVSDPTAFPLLRQQLKELALPGRKGITVLLPNRPPPVTDLEKLDEALLKYRTNSKGEPAYHSPRIVLDEEGMPTYKTTYLQTFNGNPIEVRTVEYVSTPVGQDAITPMNILAQPYNDDWLLTIVDY